MALFTYKAIDTRGKASLGQIEALNIIDLEMRLKRMGFDLISGAPLKRGSSMLRAGSVKRVASGVGEGSVVVQAIHRFLDPGVG